MISTTPSRLIYNYLLILYYLFAKFLLSLSYIRFKLSDDYSEIEIDFAV